MLSTREVRSTRACGQDGPPLSTDTRVGWPALCSMKYGAPESYGQALVLGAGASAVTPTLGAVTVVTVTWPVCSRVDGTGLELVREPKPVSRRMSPACGTSRFNASGRMSLIGKLSFANARSVVGD